MTGIDRRQFIEMLAIAAAGGALDAAASGADQLDERLYDVPRFGNVHLLHLTDTHAQLRPIYFREASVNLGAGDARGRMPHRVGRAWLDAFGIAAGTRGAYAFDALDFDALARRYGRVGGFAQIATLVKRLRADRPGALLLDGGDSWQGSATALWTRGEDMIAAQRMLGVDAMTGHWEFTYGAERVAAFAREGTIPWIAQNVRTLDFDEPVFAPVLAREINGVPVAIIGQAYPYTPIAHPRRFVENWTFGIREENLQREVDRARAGGAQVVVLLSHNGADVDLKLAQRVAGIDVILGGHTHDALPAPQVAAGHDRRTLVTNAGSHGKFVAVLDLDVRGGRLRDLRYRLLPVFADLLGADPAMQAQIGRSRAPYADRLERQLAITETTLYRRGNFGGTMDQVILDALRAVGDAPIALSPGFRWGTTLLAGDPIRREDLLAQTAITYPEVTIRTLTGTEIKNVLEDVCDNLFNPDPYRQQGGDMVRVGGLTYSCTPHARIGARINDLRLDGRPLEADRGYKVAGWASVADPVGPAGRPVWELVEEYLGSRPTVRIGRIETPRLIGVDHDPGI
jgi:sulfur-oxidizing protein SoxB